MKLNHFKKHAISKISLLFAMVILVASCNKTLPDATPIIYPDTNAINTSLSEVISTDPSYSFYKVAITRAGMLPLLSDSSRIFTLLLPNNDAFIASGIPSEAGIGALPIASVAGIVQYSIIPGEQFLSTDTSLNKFPNLQLPTSLTIGVLPGTTVPLKMSVFLSKRGSSFWANTIPVLSPDHKYKNGVIHLVGGIVAPPSKLLKDAIYGDPNLSYFKAAIARADSGATGLGKLDSLLGYGVTNMTILAPNNAAFQTLIFGLAFQSYLLSRPTPYTATDTSNATATANGAVAAGPVFLSTNNVTTAQVKGIMAYHFLATNTPAGYQPNIRVFSNNFATTPGVFYTTLVNTFVPPTLQPGVMAQATFTGPFVSNLQFFGVHTFPPTGPPYAGPAATTISKDNFAVNGVYHIIDKVLLPQ
ncbi:MAG TPA: fasciclin domain-containing protein [Hanamia sp.]|nr:fasciclin domain-containing protein [Hanamia sp.]